MKILFLCTGNSCRSQMAEYTARALAPSEGFQVSSAGTDPQEIHPLTHRVLSEVGIQSSEAQSKDLDPDQLHKFDFVITLCGDARDRCPVLPSHVCQLHWPVEDPAAAPGSQAEKMEAFRRVQRELEQRIRQLFSSIDSGFAH